MNTESAILFALSDTLDGVEVTPSAVPIGLLTQFSKDVLKFVAGSSKEVSAKNLIVAIEEGSLGLAIAKAALSVSLLSEIKSVDMYQQADRADTARAEVLMKWQQDARKHPGRRIAIYDGADVSKQLMLRISHDTNLQMTDASKWVSSERYLHGLVVDSGGSSTTNIHLRIGDDTLRVSAKPDQIARQEKNHVYHEVLLRVAAEENLETGALRNVRLLEFADYQPKFDAAAFEELTKKGAEAWKDVDDVGAWVESIRGS